MKANNIEELFGTLQQSVVEEWRKHLKTSKYSKHMALDEFYKDMPDLVDALIEDYMGVTKTKVGEYKNILKAEELDALQYLEELHNICKSGAELLGDNTELKSDLDAILSKIDSVMYKVRELKESGIKSLKDYLYESTSINESIFKSRLTDDDKKNYAIIADAISSIVSEIGKWMEMSDDNEMSDTGSLARQLDSLVSKLRGESDDEVVFDFDKI